MSTNTRICTHTQMYTPPGPGVPGRQLPGVPPPARAQPGVAPPAVIPGPGVPEVRTDSISPLIQQHPCTTTHTRPSRHVPEVRVFEATRPSAKRVPLGPSALAPMHKTHTRIHTYRHTHTNKYMYVHVHRQIHTYTPPGPGVPGRQLPGVPPPARAQPGVAPPAVLPGPGVPEVRTDSIHQRSCSATGHARA